MRLLITSIIFLVIMTFNKGLASDSCNEESLRECLTTLQKLIEDEYSFADKSEDQLKEYCLSVQKDSTCLQETSDSCKNKHPLISALSVTLFNHLNQLCNPGTDHRKIYEKLAPCFKDHSEDFLKCTGGNLSGKHDDPQLHKVCLDMESMLCVAKTSRKHCGEDGESLAKTLEFSVKDSFSEVCSGSIGFMLNYWIIVSSVLISFFFNHKIN
ncbi:uncharacterized protein NPIL_532911 [Nephila pilipes]|uniref:Uncharacterized protein n=1 Tax=Nephila pilipes TaxID=299642 RepID=A0A8X6TTA7_NEPPI|nr:uncharacterized protein NPIL_532911 [Nephila pilipes]